MGQGNSRYTGVMGSRFVFVFLGSIVANAFGTGKDRDGTGARAQRDASAAFDLARGLTALLVGAGCWLAAPLAAAADFQFVVGNATAPTQYTGVLVAFWVFGALAVLGALATISRRNLVSASVCLVFTLLCTAALFLVLHATFLAAIQVLIYAGAVMVLFLFVVMIVGHEEPARPAFLRGIVAKSLGVVALGVVVERFIRAATGGTGVMQRAWVGDDFGSVRRIGAVVFGDYLAAFEAVSVLLLVAVIAALMVTRDSSKLDVGKLDAGKLDAGKLDAGKLDAGKLDAGKLDAGKLDAGKLDAGKHMGGGG